MSKTKQELLHTQLNVEEQTNTESSNKKLIERELIEGSPFWVVGNEEKGYMLTFAHYQLTEPLDSIQAVKEHLTQNMYDLILKMVLALREMQKIENVETKLSN